MFQTPKGTRDMIGKDAELYYYLTDLIRRTYEKYGFEPLDTPVFESFELLSKKSGEEIEKEIYTFKDKSGRKLGLRFDLTVPLARVVASGQFRKPYKRYQIGKVWRYDQPQAGRWREFTQADIDVIGSEDAMADFECLLAVADIFNALGIDLKIRINNRKVLQSVVEVLDIKNYKEVFTIIDKQDKLGWQAVENELKKLVKADKAKKLLKIIKENDFASARRLIKDGAGLKGLKELDELLKLAKEFKVEKYIKTDMSLVRGLDYYTGNVFELFAGLNISVGGGGRYDSLTEALGGKKEPAVGISIGVDRVMEVLKGKIVPRAKKIFVACLPDARLYGLKVSGELRKKGFDVETDLMNRSLSKQMDYASSKGFDFVAVVGPAEIKSGKFRLKNMKTGKEENVEEVR